MARSATLAGAERVRLSELHKGVGSFPACSCCRKRVQGKGETATTSELKNAACASKWSLATGFWSIWAFGFRVLYVSKI